jgi:hypothetical protein
VVLIGRVSCGKAHRLVRAYYRKMAAGGCGQANLFCTLSFPGGWTCGQFSFGQSQTAGGAMAGCARAAPGAKIRLYKAGSHRRTLHLAQFLSTDRQVWCVIGRASSFCAAGPPPDPGLAQPPQYGATLKRDGTVTTCAVPTPGAVATCTQNWNPDAPVLPLGRRNQRDGVLCTARPTGITCKLAAGSGKGKGFWISATGVAKMRAAGARARAAATARGTILDAVSRQTVSQANSDGSVTNCEIVGGVLRTDQGENVTFAAGGVLAPDLSPQAQATVDTIEQATADGTVQLCRVWPGQLTTSGGQTIDFYVATRLTGSLEAGGLDPTDPAAVQRAPRPCTKPPASGAGPQCASPISPPPRRAAWPRRRSSLLPT